MSKERNLIKFARITVAGAVISSVAAYGETNRKISSESTLERTVNSHSLSPAEIQAMQNVEGINYLIASYKTPTEIPAPTQTYELIPKSVETIKPSINETVNSELLKQYASELPQIFVKLESNSQTFDIEQDKEDLSIYYPIYRAAQDKYGVDWFTLWIIHKEESTVSRNPAAFVNGQRHIGAMQRSPQSHPQADVDRYFQGSEQLNSIPTRNSTDPKEIIYAGASIAENTDITGSLLGALNKYSASGPAANRYARYLILKSIFSYQE